MTLVEELQAANLRALGGGHSLSDGLLFGKAAVRIMELEAEQKAYAAEWEGGSEDE